MPRIVALLLACALAQPGEQAPPITVSAAISLTDVMRQIGAAYQSHAGRRVTFNFAASNVLARQIVNGAPVDAFISADEAQLKVVEKAGMAAAGTVVPLLRNRLAIVVPNDRSDFPASPAVLTASGVRRIAIGDPAAVPAGVYARQYLERIGLWSKMRGKVLPLGSVRAVLAAVENGAADAGIVYLTDAKVSTRIRTAAVIDGAGAPEIVYFACVTASSRRQKDAAAFLGFLQTDGARRVFERLGFELLPPGR